MYVTFIFDVCMYNQARKDVTDAGPEMLRCIHDCHEDFLRSRKIVNELQSLKKNVKDKVGTLETSSEGLLTYKIRTVYYFDINIINCRYKVCAGSRVDNRTSPEDVEIKVSRMIYVGIGKISIGLQLYYCLILN